ncbi:MAG: aminotransferase class I/II-fold pyridoxal phosphate-dependent enzyme [Calditrichaeota bacterium]|nr:aminotransferase class I/II-fold pyridoxal phosphate-dependent enzyme [Calditrichota bacterium]RQW05451.1 MAG: aminotransferase class I/II-fold pyridoxal phosphate-dependent enzyme [Calditrichota bacterium]
MPLEKLNHMLVNDVESLKKEGRAKSPERIIVDFIPARNGRGPRYKLRNSTQEFLRMNSNSYLSLSHHPELVGAADEATHLFGVGPGAVRFIDGTYHPHVELENKIASFLGYSAAKIFNSAYTANCGLALAISNDKTYWIGDQLNHNSIIRAMRIAGIPRDNKAIYKHNDMDELKKCLEEVPGDMERVIIITDGIFSMRGDYAPLDKIVKLAEQFHDNFADGVITVTDDCHGTGAYGETGRGTPEFTGARPDIITTTFGKAFGVNGGAIVASPEVIEAVRQKADTYIYSNPLSPADCAAAVKAIEITERQEGKDRLKNLQDRISQFRQGLEDLGFESIPGPHPVVPLLVRDTAKTHQLVQHLFDNGILAVGLTFPVVPRGDETIRFQVNAAHTSGDIQQVLDALAGSKN